MAISKSNQNRVKQNRNPFSFLAWRIPLSDSPLNRTVERKKNLMRTTTIPLVIQHSFSFFHWDFPIFSLLFFCNGKEKNSIPWGVEKPFFLSCNINIGNKRNKIKYRHPVAHFSLSTSLGLAWFGSGCGTEISAINSHRNTIKKIWNLKSSLIIPKKKELCRKGFVGNYKCRKMENGKMDDVSNRK